MFFSLCLHRLSREGTWEASYRANTLDPGLSPMSYVSFSCCIALPFPAAIHTRRPEETKLCFGLFRILHWCSPRSWHKADFGWFLISQVLFVWARLAAHMLWWAHLNTGSWIAVTHFFFLFLGGAVESGMIYSRLEMLNCQNHILLWNMNSQTHLHY